MAIPLSIQLLNSYTTLVGVILILVALSGCTQPDQSTLFSELSPEETGIHFRNTITETEGEIDENLYMGGGVGIGDFNNDGLKDIYLSGNQVSSQLYINKGNNRFEDITEKANAGTKKWATGVSIADINNDGYDDIYVCVYGGENLLFVNQQDLTFKESATAYGVNDDRYSTQSVFFDYNKDGNVDLFLTNYFLDGPNPNVIRKPDQTGNSPMNDRLYKNMGGTRGDHPYFKNVAFKAGISGNGYGLGAVVSDFNRDLWPDIYVTNDFLGNDELWQNNKDGTFTNVIGTALRHQSYSSMGVDAADLNNDLLPDIVTLDMMPEINSRRKMQYTFMNYNRYQQERAAGFQPSFMRNMLQLNNGNRTIKGRTEPFFSEIGQYAGISETAWSWGILAADFNNDGQKDLFITNGSGRHFLNADFIEYSISEAVGMRGNAKNNPVLSKRLKELGYIKSSNYLYLNNSDYTFTNANDSSGLAEPTISTGAAYADLDNDGDLDLVVNHINKTTSIYRNNTINTNNQTQSNHYLKVSLQGDSTNTDAFGTRVFLYAGGQQQMQEHYPVRGYASSVDPTLLFGLGNLISVDSLKVTWNDSKTEIVHNISADTLHHFNYENANLPSETPSDTDRTLFGEVTHKKGIAYSHLDIPYNDFKLQPLLPQKYSQLGPKITVGDVNSDSLTDFFIGGGFNSSGMLFMQQKNGRFTAAKFDSSTKYQEDMDCTLFDVENDGDLDLLITYGDTRYDSGSEYYKPRLYLNNGSAHFQLQPYAIPDHVRTVAGAVAVADYDGDGYKDVFIGGQVSSNMFPKLPTSFLLRNQQGRFRDVTKTINPVLQNPGMITSAEWTDINNDTRPDLIMTGEWMSPRLFKNTGQLLEEVINPGMQKEQGLWRSMVMCDLDQDGDKDLVMGNLGQNNPYDVSQEYPLKLFAADIDQNSFLDPVMFYYQKNEAENRNLYPAVRRDKLLRQVPTLKKVFPNNKSYTNATMDDIFGTVDKVDILELTVTNTKSILWENTGEFTFRKHDLPPPAQFAPIDAIICKDLDRDGTIDLLLAGNEYRTEVRTGRYDASYGLFLKGEESFKFNPLSSAESGFIINGDVKDMKLITDAQNRKLILVAVNDDSLRAFQIR